MEAQRMTRVHWLICLIASIGFAFDIYELLMLPLVVKPALASLANVVPGSPEYTNWARTLFFLPAIFGGIFGLYGGYLTDRLGRRRVLTWSILLYAFSAMGSGFVTAAWQLLVLRCLVFAGVCIEFVAAVAWLAELFENPKQRERVLGFTQAFSSLGGLLVGVSFYLCARYAIHLPAIYGGHEAWRYTLISGVIPALPLILIRPFLPESPKWQAKRQAGTLRRPSFIELFSPHLVRTTVVTTLMFAASYGVAFGAIQQLPQVLSGHKYIVDKTETLVGEANEKAIAETGQPLPASQRRALAGGQRDEVVASVTIWQEVGGLVGRFLLAILAVVIVSRRALLRLFQIPQLIFVPLLFYWISTSLSEADSMGWIKIGIFAAGLLTVAQFSFWGNYIPRVFPLHLRGTGESFAANIGGRIFGTAAAWLTLTFAASERPDPAKIAYVGAIVAFAYCMVGTILCFFLPEPPRDLEDDD